MNVVSTDRETGQQGDREKAQVPVEASDLAAPVLLRPYARTDYESVLALWEEAKLRPYTERELERLLTSGGGALVAVQLVQMAADDTGRRATGEARAASQTGTSAPGARVVGIVLWSHNGSIGILWRLAVAATVRGQGIATKLLDRAEQDIREAGFDGVCLLTRSTNTIARAMYAKRGYHWNEIHEFWGKKLPDDIKENIKVDAIKVNAPATGAEETGGLPSC